MFSVHHPDVTHHMLVKIVEVSDSLKDMLEQPSVARNDVDALRHNIEAMATALEDTSFVVEAYVYVTSNDFSSPQKLEEKWNAGSWTSSRGAVSFVRHWTAGRHFKSVLRRRSEDF